MTGNTSAKTPQSNTLNVRASLQKFKEYLIERAAMEGAIVAGELGDDQTAKILAAATEEELEEAMKTAQVVGLREIPDGTLIQINGFHLAPGTRDEFSNRFGVFSVLDITLLSKTERWGKPGTNLAVDTGVERIITWLRAVESGQIKGLAFPVQRLIVKVPSGKGEMITLRKLPVAPVAGEVV